LLIEIEMLTSAAKKPLINSSDGHSARLKAAP
jgi:hypothetical protein